MSIKVKFYLLTVVVFSLTLVGCSSYYSARQFPSKEKFYEDFNSSAKNKNMKVTLTDDSSFITSEGTMISNDSLIFTTITQKEEMIDKNEIKDIKYSGNDMSNLSGRIILKNGDSATTKNIVFNSDSSINAKVFERKNDYIPVTEIKKLTYKNRLPGFFTGLIIGIPSGVFAALIAAIFSNDVITKDETKLDSYYKTGVIVGPIIGGILGAIIGYNYTYIINP